MTRLLHYLTPRHIGSQIAVLIVMSLAIANGVTATVFLLQPPPKTESTVGVLAGLAFTARLLDAAPTPQAQADILRTARESLPSLIELDALPPTATDFTDIRPIHDLRAVLGDRYKVYVLRPGEDDRRGPPRVAIRLSDHQFIAAELPPPPSNRLPMLIGTVMFLAVVLTLLFLWVGRALTAPLARITNAAEQFSVDRLDAPLPESGPAEVRGLARALNDMRGRIRAMVDDRTRMLAAIGHDLRTPITRLRLRAEEIEQTPLQGQVIRDLDTMQYMVQSALAFLREQSTGESQHVLVDLPSVIQVLCDDFADMGHPLSYNAPPHLYLHCDPDQITRAVMNLVHNGLKYGTAVTVRIVSEPGAAVIEVEDNGPGIGAAERAKVIEPFYRGDPARGLGNGASFGLGLSIASTIVAAHSGKLELNDAKPHGLLARMILPLSRPA